MREVGRNVTLEDADRRVVIMSNPGALHKHHSTNTLYFSCSIYNPGESCQCTGTPQRQPVRAAWRGGLHDHRG